MVKIQEYFSTLFKPISSDMDAVACKAGGKTWKMRISVYRTLAMMSPCLEFLMAMEVFAIYHQVMIRSAGGFVCRKELA